MNKKKEYTITIVISIKVKSKLKYQDMINEFGQECDYNIPSTNNVKVINTEIQELE